MGGGARDPCPQGDSILMIRGIVHVLREYLFFFFFLRFYLFIFREKEGGGEGEKHQRVVASCTPLTGDLAYNPDMCPELGIKPVTLWFAGWCSIHWATPARWGSIYSDWGDKKRPKQNAIWPFLLRGSEPNSLVNAERTWSHPINIIISSFSLCDFWSLKLHFNNHIK